MTIEKSELSLFWLNEIFPNPKNIFSAGNKSLDEIKDDCFVAIDANVLLLPYKLQDVSLQDVINVYKPLCLKNKLVIPAQSAREFAKNRTAKVAELVSYLRDQSSLDMSILKKKVGALNDNSHYAEITVEATKLSAEFKLLQKKLRTVADEIAADVGCDPVSLAYKEIFGNSVCDDPKECEDETKFRADLKKRYRCKRPPGFKDQSKEDDGIGDLIIWKTILEVGKKRKTNCIFVTGDEKTDWYTQANGPFQPRVELIEEYREHTNKSLHIIPLSRLLKLFKVDDAVVNNIENAEKKYRIYYHEDENNNKVIKAERVIEKNDNDYSISLEKLREINNKIKNSFPLSFIDTIYLLGLSRDGTEVNFMRVLFPELYSYYQSLTTPAND